MLLAFAALASAIGATRPPQLLLASLEGHDYPLDQAQALTLPLGCPGQRSPALSLLFSGDGLDAEAQCTVRLEAAHGTGAAQGAVFWEDEQVGA